MKKITLIIPAHNEEFTLRPLKQALDALILTMPQYLWEILFIDDGSSDHTLEIIKSFHNNDERFCYVSLSRNFGKENAMLAGFDYCTGDAAVILDADLQDPPHLIPKMIEYWENGYEDVYAKRQARGKESWIRRKLSLLFYRVLQNSTRFEVLENVGDFRLLDRCCINALRQMREYERYTKGMFCWIGFKKQEILFDRGDRTIGTSNFRFSTLFNLALDGITSFTTTPLRVSSVVGIIVSLGAVFYMIWILIKTLVWGEEVAGYPTMMVVILFLGGIQLLSLGIIGEYLGRIFNESKRRPVYLVREYNGEKLFENKAHD